MFRNIRIKFLSWRYMYALERQTDRQTETQQSLDRVTVLVSDKSPQITIRKSKLKNGPEKQTHTAK